MRPYTEYSEQYATLPLPKYIPWRKGRWISHALNGTPGAVCLDGSPATMSVWPAVLPIRNTSWVVAFQGGGWCWTPQDCALRSTSGMGSSAHVQPPLEGGILSSSCHIAPEFCTYNKVFFRYCDGASFAGGATFISNGANGTLTITSAGRAIVRAGIESLIRHYDLNKATDVLVTGSSAGGLAALLHASALREAIIASGALLRRFKLLPISGLFFRPRTWSGVPPLWPFERQMSSIQRLANVTVPHKCFLKFGRASAWRCLTDLEPLDAVPAQIPVFVIQSTFDLFSTSCILAGGESPYFFLNCSSGAWNPCIRWMTPLSNRTARRFCGEEQLEQLAAYQHTAAAALVSSRRLRMVGSGAFVHSCHDHAAYTNAWIGHKDRNDTMRKLVLRWWDLRLADHDAQNAADVLRFGNCSALGGHSQSCLQKCGTARPLYPDQRNRLKAKILAAGLKIS